MHSATAALLRSCSLDRLGKEPELLAADQAQLKRSAQETAVTHYRAFTSAASCLREVRNPDRDSLCGIDKDTNKFRVVNLGQQSEEGCACVSLLICLKEHYDAFKT